MRNPDLADALAEAAGSVLNPYDRLAGLRAAEDSLRLIAFGAMVELRRDGATWAEVERAWGRSVDSKFRAWVRRHVEAEDAEDDA